jgi:hypothetical protein
MDWELYDGQLQRGPMPDAGVYDAIRSGLPRNAYIRQKGASEWVPIEMHPLFASALQQRSAPGQWGPPPPPPPPAYVGAVALPAAPDPTRALPYAVAGPHAGKLAPRKLVARGCLLQCLGTLPLLGAGFVLYGRIDRMLEVAGALAIVGLTLLLVGGLVNRRWICGLCKTPLGDRSVLVCPTCHASFT